MPVKTEKMEHTTTGQRLKACRERLEMSQSELARRSGVDRVYIVRLESGERQEISLRLASALAETLQISLDYLAGRTNVMV